MCVASMKQQFLKKPWEFFSLSCIVNIFLSDMSRSFGPIAPFSQMGRLQYKEGFRFNAH